MTKQHKIWASTAAMLLAIFAFFLLIKKDHRADGDENAVNAAPDIKTVNLVPIQTATIDETMPASGLIAANETATVGARVTGAAIESVNVRVGDWVNAGDVLAVLDNSAQQNQTASAAAQLEEAKIAADKAQKDLARVTPLVEIDAISRQQYDAYIAARDQADARVRALSATLATSQTQQQNTQVRAPVSGVIGQKQAQVGMMTTGAALFEIIKNGELEWQPALDPESVAKLQTGQAALIDGPAGQITGTVRYFAPTADNARQIVVHTTLANADGLYSGMYQRGAFIMGSQTATVVPFSALDTQDGRHYVWVAVTDNQENGAQNAYKAHRTRVEKGELVGDKVAILPAADADYVLNESSLIVADGVSFLREGELIKDSGQYRTAVNATKMAENSTINNNTTATANTNKE